MQLSVSFQGSRCYVTLHILSRFRRSDVLSFCVWQSHAAHIVSTWHRDKGIHRQAVMCHLMLQRISQAGSHVPPDVAAVCSEPTDFAGAQEDLVPALDT